MQAREDITGAARRQFAYYKHLGDRVLERLDADQLHWEPVPGGNSVATLAKHLAGNMRSRFVDFLTADGEKPTRDREGEFAADAAAPEVVRMRWERGWAAVFAALDEVDRAGLRDPDGQERIVYIRAKGHTVTEALLRQLCHYGYHVGQMVLLARMLLGDAWESLSIPRGGSAAYNAASFAAGPRREHFTEEFLGSVAAPPRDAQT